MNVDLAGVQNAEKVADADFEGLMAAKKKEGYAISMMVLPFSECSFLLSDMRN